MTTSACLRGDHDPRDSRRLHLRDRVGDVLGEDGALAGELARDVEVAVDGDERESRRRGTVGGATLGRVNRKERRALFELVVRDACERAGSLARETRRAAADGEPLPGATGELVERIRHAAHTVSDAEITAARAEGHDDDRLYELTVTTALGESRRRLRAVLRALGREG
jgi:hypothetical protein